MKIINMYVCFKFVHYVLKLRNICNSHIPTTIKRKMENEIFQGIKNKCEGNISLFWSLLIIEDTSALSLY